MHLECLRCAEILSDSNLAECANSAKSTPAQYRGCKFAGIMHENADRRAASNLRCLRASPHCRACASGCDVRCSARSRPCRELARARTSCPSCDAPYSQQGNGRDTRPPKGRTRSGHSRHFPGPRIQNPGRGSAARDCDRTRGEVLAPERCALYTDGRCIPKRAGTGRNGAGGVELQRERISGGQRARDGNASSLR